MASEKQVVQAANISIDSIRDNLPRVKATIERGDWVTAAAMCAQFSDAISELGLGFVAVSERKRDEVAKRARQ